MSDRSVMTIFYGLTRLFKSTKPKKNYSGKTRNSFSIGLEWGGILGFCEVSDSSGVCLQQTPPLG